MQYLRQAAPRRENPAKTETTAGATEEGTQNPKTSETVDQNEVDRIEGQREKELLELERRKVSAEEEGETLDLGEEEKRVNAKYDAEILALETDEAAADKELEVLIGATDGEPETDNAKSIRETEGKLAKAEQEGNTEEAGVLRAVLERLKANAPTNVTFESGKTEVGGKSAGPHSTEKIAVKSLKNAEFEVGRDESGEIISITNTRTGKKVPKFVERKGRLGNKRVVKNGTYTTISEQAEGTIPSSQIKKEEKEKFRKALDAFIPTTPYEHALLYLAQGSGVDQESVRKETGDDEIKWASRKNNKFAKKGELPSIERASELIWEETMDTEGGTDAQDVRDELIEIISTFDGREAVEKEIISRHEESFEKHEKNALGLTPEEEGQVLSRMTEKELDDYHAELAETEYLQELSNQEILEYYEERYGTKQQREESFEQNRERIQREESGGTPVAGTEQKVSPDSIQEGSNRQRPQKEESVRGKYEKNPRSPELEELDRQIAEAEQEVARAKTALDNKAKRLDQTIVDDQKDLFNEHKSQQDNPLFDERVDLSKRKEATAPEREALRKAQENLSELQAERKRLEESREGQTRAIDFEGESETGAVDISNINVAGPQEVTGNEASPVDFDKEITILKKVSNKAKKAEAIRGKVKKSLKEGKISENEAEAINKAVDDVLVGGVGKITKKELAEQEGESVVDEVDDDEFDDVPFQKGGDFKSISRRKFNQLVRGLQRAFNKAGVKTKVSTKEGLKLLGKGAARAQRFWDAFGFDRVMPRDLFNEAKAVSMYLKFIDDYNNGRLPEGFFVSVDGKTPKVGLSQEGELFVEGVTVEYNGEPVRLEVGYNAGKNDRFPLTVTSEGIDVFIATVYDESGKLDEEFTDEFGEDLGQPERPVEMDGDWQKHKDFLNQLGVIGLWDVNGMLPDGFVFYLKDPKKGFGVTTKNGITKSNNLTASINGKEIRFFMNKDGLMFNRGAKVGKVLSGREMSNEFKKFLDKESNSNVRYMKGENGVPFGMVDLKTGNIYLDGARMNANTPVHEFAHLWISSVRQANPQLWERMVSLAKQTPEWKRLKNDPNYKQQFGNKKGKELDNAMADETWAWIIGDKGEANFDAILEKMNGDRTLAQKVWDAVQDFWETVRGFFADNATANARKFANMQIRTALAPNIPGARMMYVGADGNLNIPGLNRRSLGENLVVAAKMEKAGKPAGKIRLATGWFKNKKDGKWRYQLSDKNATFTAKGKKLLNNRSNKTIALVDLINHERLFSVYPELKNVKVEFENGNTGTNAIGSREIDKQGRSKIILRPDKVGTSKEDGFLGLSLGVVLHEAQHIIQQKEGFPTGANYGKAIAFLLDKHKSEIKTSLGKKVGIKSPESDISSALRVVEKETGKRADKLIHRAYLSYLGELEARSTQYNLNFTEEELAMLSPYESQLQELGISFDEAIVDVGGKNAKGLRLQASVFHGSPHVFTEFSLSKIGTGEGAQAFGWGLYFTSLENIARHYANALSGVAYDGDYDSLEGKYKIALMDVKTFGGIDAVIEKEKKKIAEVQKDLADHPGLSDLMEISQDKIVWLEENRDKITINRNLYKATLHKGKPVNST